MSLNIEHDGQTYQVPREVEAEGPAAVEAWFLAAVAAPSTTTSDKAPATGRRSRTTTDAENEG